MIRETFNSETFVWGVLANIELFISHLAFDPHQNCLAGIDIEIVGREPAITRKSIQPPDRRFGNFINDVVISDMH